MTATGGSPLTTTTVGVVDGVHGRHHELSDAYLASATHLLYRLNILMFCVAHGADRGTARRENLAKFARRQAQQCVLALLSPSTEQRCRPHAQADHLSRGEARYYAPTYPSVLPRAASRFQGRMSALRLEMTEAPTARPAGQRMYAFSPSA